MLAGACTPASQMTRDLRYDFGESGALLRLTGKASPVAQRDRLRGIYVLLVDDDPDTLDIFGSYLRHHGAHIRGAASGQEALAYLAIARPNVIVTDQMMPGMSGVELLEQVRKMAGDTQRPIPVILCSAVGGLTAAAKAKGFSSYFTKPVDPQALVDEIARLAGA